MEVILITPNRKYQTLISATKTIQSTSVDLYSVIQTDLIVKHYNNISLFSLKDNLPYQYHHPVKISKQILNSMKAQPDERDKDKDSGHYVQLLLNPGLIYKIQPQSDNLQIIAAIQQYIKDKDLQEENTLNFTLKYKDITIKYILLNQPPQPQQNKVKQTIVSIQTKSNASISHNMLPPEEIKLVVFVDECNYEDFLSWSENEGDFYDFQLNEKLHKEYMALKQQIDNQKNSFRNKIKMVETILGENINIDKLLSEEKEENTEYKRLRETFQTIKNIDNVIIEQQKKIQVRSIQLKEKRTQKHKIHYENAKLFAKKKAELMALRKQLQQMKYKVDCVSEQKQKYEKRRNFEMNEQIKQIVEGEFNKYKGLLKNINNFQKNTDNINANLNKNIKNRVFSKYNEQNADTHYVKPKTFQSLHKSQKKQMERYQCFLKKKAHQSFMEKQNNNAKNQQAKMYEEMKKYQTMLKNMADYYEKNYKLLIQMKTKLQSESKIRNSSFLSTSKSYSFYNPSSSSALYEKIKWSEQQFYVLNQLLQIRSTHFNFNPTNNSYTNSIDAIDGAEQLKNGSNVSINGKYASNCTIQQNKQNKDKQKDRKNISYNQLNNNTSALTSKTKQQKPQNNASFMLNNSNTTTKLVKTKIKPALMNKNNGLGGQQNKNILISKKIIKINK